MPRSYASRRSRIASSSECSPHQPVEIVQRPKPTSEAGIPVDPNSRVLMLAVYVGGCGRASGDERLRVEVFGQARDPRVGELDKDREREVEAVAAVAQLRGEVADREHPLALLEDGVERDPAVLDRAHPLREPGPDLLAAVERPLVERV